ncbi:hypothetical protein [Streptomyces albidus (ex Kaewkla and Franco 2022)]|uniref:hypothetical protein n=1 Tax=Streptomyces albidus (ex Kaewkla and Franco 2022) TaxID=722709 RepID=UPI0015EF2DD0|nr:hypothetical protein [Streptomyces albidus (ex Kaewkla and Franco 2022)]
MTAGADLRLLRTAVFTAVCVTLSAGGHSLTGGGRIPYWSLGAACAVIFVIALPLAGRERSLPGIAGLLAAGQLGLHTLFSCAPAPSGSAAAGAHSHGGIDVRGLAARLLCGEESAGRISESRARQVVSDAGIDPGRLSGGTGMSGHEGLAHHHAAGHASHHPAGHGADAAGSAMSAADTPLECLRSAAHAALSFFDVPMLLGHLMAALVLGWLLRRGETALWQLVRLSARSARGAGVHVRALGTAFALVRVLRGGLLPDLPQEHCFEGTCEQRAPRSVLLHHSVHRRGPPRTGPQESFALAA